MKISLKIMILIFSSIVSLPASVVDDLLGDYSDIAIVHIDANKSIEDLIVISGKDFSLKTLSKEPTVIIVTHPQWSGERRTYILLKGPKRVGVSRHRAILCKPEEFQYIEKYGSLRLADLLKHKTGSVGKRGP